MIIVTSSCSYRQHLFHTIEMLKQYNSPPWWTNYHVGEPGRSNKWISQSIIHQIDKIYKDMSQDEPIIAIANWSSVDRTDLTVDKISNEYHKNLRFENYAHPDHINGNHSYRTFKWFGEDTDGWDDSKESGLLSLTNINPKNDSKHDLEKWAALYRKYFYNKPQQFEQTLIGILLLQQYCQQKGILLLNCTWQDIWHDSSEDDFGTPGGLGGQTQIWDIENKPEGRKSWMVDKYIDNYNTLPLRIDKHPQYRYLYDQINFDNWYFYKSNRCQTGGVADWCVETNADKYFKDLHPTYEGWHGFATQEFYPWVHSKLREHNILK